MALIFIGTMLLFQPATDPDFGWQYKYGEYIVTHQELLKDNIFSFTYANYQWANSYWVSQIIFFVFFNIFGLAFSPLLFSFIFSSFVWLIISKLPKGNTFSKTTVFIITLLPIISYQIVVRPMYFSSFFLLSLVYVLLYKPKLIRFTPLLFVVWANMHADFTMGLLIVAVYKFFEVIKLYREKTLTSQFFLKSSVNYAACLLATLVNPYGIGLWTTLLKDTSHFFKLLSINEMLPVNIYTASVGEVVMLLLFPGIILSVAVLIPTVNKILNRKTEFGAWYISLLIIFFIWSIRSIYFVRILFLVGMPGFYYLLNLYSSEIAKRFEPQVKKNLRLIGIMTIVMISLVAIQTLLTNLTYALDNDYLCTKKKLPCVAVEKIKELKPEGNMFNDYSWGGYLIWQLPEYKTFIDGRMPSWKYNDNYLFEDYLKISRDYGNNKELFDNYTNTYDIRWVILKNDAKFAGELIQSNSWYVIYQDDICKVLVKR